MGPFEILLRRIFRLDPELQNAAERTRRMAAVVDGDRTWMLTCRPRIEKKIECDDGNTYKREP